MIDDILSASTFAAILTVAICAGASWGPAASESTKAAAKASSAIVELPPVTVVGKIRRPAEVDLAKAN
jgi:hypothetical protein